MFSPRDGLQALALVKTIMVSVVVLRGADAGAPEEASYAVDPRTAYTVNVRVIKPGSCIIDPGKMVSPIEVSLKQQLGVGGGSTVALIQEEGEVLLVDTGYDHESDFSPTNDQANWELLTALLAQNGIPPEAITKVFITHFHRDHFGGIERFENATWHCHRTALADLKIPNREKFIPLDEGDRITSNAIVVHTPGHTKGHASILWTDERRLVRVAICGDAVLSLAWLQSGYTWRFNTDFFEVKAARESAARLLKEADILIPGHGQPFFSRTGRSLDQKSQRSQSEVG